MVRSNLKKLMALALAATMVVGSSVTAFATAGSSDGEGGYEGNDVNFGAATTLTVPTAPTTGFGYIADPNGLIKESGSSHYDKAKWSDTAKGVFFKTSGDATNGYTYSENSASLEVVNNNASPIRVSAKIKQKASDTGTVVFTNDATFGGDTPSTAKSVYIAVTDGTNVKAIASGGAEVELPISVAGKLGNYELVWDDTLNEGAGGYKYDLKSGVTTEDKTKWNKTEFYVTGALNENADWSGTGITFPAITVTWDTTAGAVPLKVRDGKASEITLTHTGAVTISKILAGDAEITTDVLSRENPTEEAGGKVKVTAAQAKALYPGLKGIADGVALDVVYSDGYVEPIVVFSR